MELSHTQSGHDQENHLEQEITYPVEKHRQGQAALRTKGKAQARQTSE